MLRSRLLLARAQVVMVMPAALLELLLVLSMWKVSMMPVVVIELLLLLAVVSAWMLVKMGSLRNKCPRLQVVKT
jgi:hypothetical protein